MPSPHRGPLGRLLLPSLACCALLASTATAQNTSQLSENGWYSDDTRADGTGTETAGTNLISPTLTDDPEATASGTAAHDADILNQISIGAAVGAVPPGTNTGAVHLQIGPTAAGKSQISHRKDDGVGHCTGSAAFGPGMTAEYSWMGDGTPTVTASLKFGVKTSEFGATGVSSRTGENAWDKVMIYEPGNLNGGTSDGTWQTETIDFTTGRWWFFDRTEGAGTIGMPMTLSDMSTTSVTFGSGKSVQDVYDLVTASGAHVTSVQLGIGSGNAGGSVHVNQVETNFYRPGSITTFGPSKITVTEFAPSSNTLPGVWYETFVTSNGMASIVDLTGAGGALENDQPLPRGAGLLTTTTDNNDRANVGLFDAAFGTPGDVFSTLRIEYSYLKASNAGQNLTAAPSLKLAIFNSTCDDPLSSGDCFGTLVYEPSWNQPAGPGTSIDPPLDQWEHEVIDGDNGLFWWTGGFGQPNTAGGPPLQTLNQWLAVMSSDFGDAAIAQIQLGVGSFNQNQIGYVDSVLIAHGFGGGLSRCYDFDPPETGELRLTSTDCQDDVDLGASGHQISIELEMLDLSSSASGFFAFVDYDLGVLAYRGDLSSYTASPFSLHISPIGQGDDGLLELDGSIGFGDSPTSADALLATLVFDVLVPCDPASPPVTFEVGGTFPSELSLDGDPIDTTLTDPAPFTLDDTPPVLSGCPTDITRSADASTSDGCLGAVVTWVDPTATDDCDPSPVVVCTPPSGSLFPVGTTTVTCTATDACGNQSSCAFDVTVNPTNELHLEVELCGVQTPGPRCIRLVMDDCSFTDVVLAFVDHDLSPTTPVRAQAVAEVPCGEYVFVCAKDQQHTQWDTTSVTQVGTVWMADTLLSLEGGDTDDDGDVDIHDVTLMISQFGELAHPGGCPWDGTRDADFDNDGAVGSSDYTFLTANWLSTSACSCSTFAGHTGSIGSLDPRARAVGRSASRADLNGDGWIDWQDVEIFEQRAGFAPRLSTVMRTR